MIADLLPDTVSSAELFHDPPGIVLPADEDALLVHPSPRRKAEFTSGRLCARRALAGLGIGPVPILRGERREPCWPDGVVGSITHCTGYRAAAVARADDVVTIGIDAEPNRRLPDGVIEAIALPAERALLAELSDADPTVSWDRLLFSAKESVYKAWFPLARRWLGFEEVETAINSTTRTFTCHILVDTSLLSGDILPRIAGNWRVTDALVLTAAHVSDASLPKRMPRRGCA